MGFMTISKAAADFVGELHSDELEIFCGLDLGKSDQALSLRLTALFHLIDRLDTGRQSTAIDRRKADKFRGTAKTIIVENPFLQTNPDDIHFLNPTKNKKKRFLSSDLIYTSSSYFIRIRLFLHRLLNKVLPNFSRFSEGILPTEFSLLGIFGGIIEFIGHAFVIGKSTATKPINQKTGEELTRWQRFKISYLHPKEQETALEEEQNKQQQYQSTPGQRFLNVLRKGTRPIAMINASVWPIINTITYKPIIHLISAKLPALVVIGAFTAATSTFIVAALNIAGTVMDIFLDTGSALYGYLKHRSLLNKLTELNKKSLAFNPLLLKKAKTALDEKLKEVMKTKVIRLFSYNLTLSMAMVLMLAPALTPVGATIALGIAFAGALADLPNFFTKSNYEKFRTLAVLGILAAAIAGAILLVTMPPLVFTLPIIGVATLSVPFIGGCVALLVGTIGFGRVLTFADREWGAEKIGAIKESPVGNFFRNLVSTKTPAPNQNLALTNPRTTSLITSALQAEDDEFLNELASSTDSTPPHLRTPLARSGNLSPLYSPGPSPKMAQFISPKSALHPSKSSAIPRLPIPRNKSDVTASNGDDSPLRRITSVPDFRHSPIPAPSPMLFQMLGRRSMLEQVTERSFTESDGEDKLPPPITFVPPSSPPIALKIPVKSLRDAGVLFQSKSYRSLEEESPLSSQRPRSISTSPRKFRSHPTPLVT